MKTTQQDCFSNGTEHDSWREINCDRCWKSSHPLDEDSWDWTNFICSIDRDIHGQMAGLHEIPLRTYNITQMRDCPYRQAERPKRKKYSKKEVSNCMDLFNN